MTLLPWNAKREGNGSQPAPLTSFRREMDRLFDMFFGEASTAAATAMEMWSPSLDIEENEHEIIVRAEMPGIRARDLDLTVTGNALVIAGEKKEHGERKGEGFVHSERRFGSFRRDIPLPLPVDPENVNAEFVDGVLTVHLKKAAESIAKRISIKTT